MPDTENLAPPRSERVFEALRLFTDQLLAEPAVRRQLRDLFGRLLEALGPDESDDGKAAPAPTETVELSESDTICFGTEETQFIQPAGAPPDVLSSQEALRKLKWAQSSDSRLSSEERQVVAQKAEAAGEFTGRPVTWRAVPDTELAWIPKRCRIKAAACRWKLERRRMLEAGKSFAEDIEPRDASLIAEAKQLPDCFLWMNYQEGSSGESTAPWDTLADAFEALADAVAALEEAHPAANDVPDLFHEALDLAAAAQSALRIAARAVHYDDEPEQDRAYNWLKRTAAERGQYIGRHMRVDDPADPTQSAELRRRIVEFRQRLETRKGFDKFRKKRLGTLKHHAGLIRTDRDGDQSYNWQKVIATVDELVAHGEHPSSKEIRQHLLPIFEDFPAGDLPPTVEQVLHEIDRFLSEHPDEEPETSATKLTREVQEVARRLAGKSIVLIGGVRKPGHVAALKEAFRLKDVVWVPTREHQSVTKFEPYVRQPDVAVVVLAIRWTSHSYGEVKDYCDQYGKPFVRLKAGYNPVQVAAHILEQVSDRLPVDSPNAESA